MVSSGFSFNGCVLGPGKTIWCPGFILESIAKNDDITFYSSLLWGWVYKTLYTDYCVHHLYILFSYRGPNAQPDRLLGKSRTSDPKLSR